MSIKLMLKFFCIFVAFASFLGNIAYSFKEEAFELALANAKKYALVKFAFVDFVVSEEFNTSTDTLIWWHHDVRSYCQLIGCKNEKLEELLNGKILPDGRVSNDMIKDFINLAKAVIKKLEEDEKKPKKKSLFYFS